MVLFGRVFLGIGGESSGVAAYAILSKWFRSKELAFSLGLNLNFYKGGGVLDDVVQANFIALILVIVAVIAAILVLAIDRYEDKRMAANNEEDLIEQKPKIRELFNLPPLYWLVVFDFLIMEMAIDVYCYMVTKMMIIKYGMDEEYAGGLYNIVGILPSIVSPLVGIYVDKRG